MENVTQEQFLALGAIGLAIIGVAVLVSFAIMAGTLKLSISWIGNSTPSFFACCGWLLGISFVNCFLIYGTLIVFGQNATLLVTPLTWFVTLYMISTAADCGLIRAFGIWMTNSILSTIGIVALIFVCMIPLAIIGAGVETASDNLDNEFENVEAMMADIDTQMDELDQLDLPEATNVGFQEVQFGDSIDQDDEVIEEPVVKESASTESAPTETARNEFRSKVAVELAETSPRSSVKPKSQPKQTRGSKPKNVRRAADGSMVNPFFQD